MAQNSIQMISSAISDRGLNEKRAYNEDSYLEMPERGLFAVADGVGGAQAGDVASQMSMEILAEAFNNLREGGDVEEMMSIAISHANKAIYQMSHELAQLSTMATTIVALQISDNIATIGHAGDSRLYRLDSRGNLFRETQDHSVVEEEVRAGRMTPEQAENHPSKNVISRALGAESTVEVDLKTIMFEADTTFLLCSDGITRHIPDVEIRELLALPHPPVLICQQMKDICYERGAEDNLTAVIIRLAANGVAQIADDEESTIAATRPLMETQPQYDEIPTQNLRMAEEIKLAQADTIEDLPQMSIPATEPVENSISISGNDSAPTQTVIPKDERTYVIGEESRNGGGAGKLFTFLLGLFLGLILAAIGYYLWSLMQTPEPQPQPITQMQSPNIPFTSFEKLRRDVDNNPGAYIATTKGKEDDVEGHYLLGRALMLTGKHEQALTEFAEAKKGLADYKGENKATIQNEIALATAAITSLESTKKFEAEISKPSASTANSNVSSDVPR